MADRQAAPPHFRFFEPVDSPWFPGQLGGVKKKSAKVEETAAPYAAKKPAKLGKAHRAFTAIIQRENDGFVAHCPELDVASQGDTMKEARANLAEAVELFLEAASPTEIAKRLRSETYVTKLEVAFG